MAQLQSMTGYGKSILELENGRLTFEIKTVNGKNADISIKSQMLPKDKELIVRQYISQELHRGSIDLFITWQPNGSDSESGIDTGRMLEYFKSIKGICSQVSGDEMQLFVELLPSLMRMPEVIPAQKRVEIINGENWDRTFEAVKEAVANTVAYRIREGQVLKADVTAKVNRILDLSREVEKYEQERIAAVREKILSRFAELKLEVDSNRLEQEMMFYIEKLDINEERVRLRQHCAYFLETLENEPFPGRKLGFIAQEMGREINTTGSKSNHVQMQQLVVKMKDELEKIKEQSLNIL
ncbi:MAG: YicC family protein [Candidatus Cryptobacteroides sp.]